MSTKTTRSVVKKVKYFTNRMASEIGCTNDRKEIAKYAVSVRRIVQRALNKNSVL